MKKSALIIIIKLIVVCGLTVLEAVEKTSEITGMTVSKLMEIVPDRFK